MGKTLKERFGTLWKELRRGNWDYVFDALASKLPFRLFSYYHGIVVVTDNIDLAVVAQPEYFKKFVSLEDLDKLERFGIPKSLVRERLQSGYRAVIVGRDDEVFSIVWGAPGNEKYPGPDGFVLYQAQTREDHRKRGLVFMAYQELYDRYKAEGKCRAYGTINRLNETSFRVHKKFHFETVGDFVYLTLLGLGLCLYFKWPFPTTHIQVFIKKPPRNKSLWFLP